ncbi:MAG: glutathione S-transferase family protein [Myxococcota bacterium]
MRLYDYLESGNGYKVRLLLHQLERRVERIELDIVAGETRTPEFLALNANGRIPTLVLDDGTVLPESNAILCYLAEGTRFWPQDRVQRAQVLRWLFFEQYSHEPYIAVLRFWAHTGALEEHASEVPERRVRGEQALAVMEEHLDGRDFFVETYGVADIALYAYTHVADEGGYDLGAFPRVRAWIGRVAAQPGHIPITQG